MTQETTFDPFYLKGEGPNLLTPEIKEMFLEQSDLNREDPKVEELIELIELKTLDLSPYESFVAWIISQQISGIVAEKIRDRLYEQLGDITPQRISNADNQVLREVGLSNAKITYVNNLAEFFLKGNAIDDYTNYNSNEIVDHYCQVKGIGPWTVNMFLIFSLGRLDVIAPKDLVVRKGLRILYSLDSVPLVKEARKICRGWKELGTVGTILSWAAMGE